MANKIWTAERVQTEIRLRKKAEAELAELLNKFVVLESAMRTAVDRIMELELENKGK